MDKWNLMAAFGLFGAALVVSTFVITYIYVKMDELFDILVTLKNLPNELTTIHQKINALAEMIEDTETRIMRQFEPIHNALPDANHKISSLEMHIGYIKKEVGIIHSMLEKSNENIQNN